MLSPHLPGRAAQPDAPSSYCAPWRRQGGGGASLDTFRVSSLSLGQSPVGPGCKVEGRWRNGRGGEEGVVRKIAATRSAAAAGAAQHSLPHPAPGGPSTLRPTLPLGCSGLSRQDRKRATARGALGKLISKAGVRRAFCFHVLPILFARFPLQSTDPSRPPLNPALAAGDSSTVTLFPLGPAWSLHRRSRKCAVPGPLPCSETRPRGCFFDTRPPASAVVAGWSVLGNLKLPGISGGEEEAASSLGHPPHPHTHTHPVLPALFISALLL